MFIQDWPNSFVALLYYNLRRFAADSDDYNLPCIVISKPCAELRGCYYELLVCIFISMLLGMAIQYTLYSIPYAVYTCGQQAIQAMSV